MVGMASAVAVDFSTFIASNINPQFETMKGRLMGRSVIYRKVTLFPKDSSFEFDTYMKNMRTETLDSLIGTLGNQFPSWFEKERFLSATFESISKDLEEDPILKEAKDRLLSGNEVSMEEVLNRLDPLSARLNTIVTENDEFYNHWFFESDLPYDFFLLFARVEHLVQSQFELTSSGLKSLSGFVARASDDARIRLKAAQFRNRTRKLGYSARIASEAAWKMKTYCKLCNSSNMEELFEFRAIHQDKLNERILARLSGEAESSVLTLQRDMVNANGSIRVGFELSPEESNLLRGISPLITAEP